MLIHFIAGESEIAKGQALAKQTTLEQRLQPSIMLHPVGKPVANKANTVACLEGYLGPQGPSSRANKYNYRQ